MAFGLDSLDRAVVPAARQLMCLSCSSGMPACLAASTTAGSSPGRAEPPEGTGGEAKETTCLRAEGLVTPEAWAAAVGGRASVKEARLR